MAELNDYITATRKNFISNDNEGRMVKKCIIEIQGTFLVKIRNDAFNRNDGENAYEHINKFLKIVGPIKINGLTQDRFRLSIFPVSLAGAAYEWFTKECIGSITTWDNMLEKFILKFHHLSDHNEEETEEDENPNKTNNILKILRIKGNLFDFETPLWYDELADGKLNDETLALKAKIEGSWGDATPRVLKFCIWLKSSFENFHEIEYEVLVKLQECWWKVNAHEITLVTRMENFGQRPYANIKTEWANNPYLDINRTFGRDYEATNTGCTQENQEHKGNTIYEPSNCKVRRFEMMKYSFNDEEEYITIKESEYINHSKDSIDAYRELLRLINEGWVVTTPEE
ncbi:hypothetical protein Tco_1450011 [Tanacetum coccineum]